jgi:hypothetical protein
MKMMTDKKGKHGGRRAGAGRPPLPNGHTTIVSVTLTAKHIALVERWQEDEDCTFSEAIRQMIDGASHSRWSSRSER